MHHDSEAAQSSSPVSHNSRFLQFLVCLGCLAAGAALVSVGTSKTRLSAAGNSAPLGDETVLLDFTASWCGPCQTMSPIIDRLAQQGYPVRKVDVDQHRDVAQRFRISSMPTFVLLVNGREVMRQEGMTSEAQLRRMLLQIPSWQQELAAQDARGASGRQLATTNPGPMDSDFGPSPFAIDLGSASGPSSFSAPRAQELPANSSALAQNEPPKRGGLLPFLQRTPQPARAAQPAADAVVRGQSNEPEFPVSPAIVGDPQQASTRLRVKDPSGMNFGSGTIIESRIGRTLILTCGHIFRHLGENGVIEVDVFLKGRPPVTYVGKVVHFNAEADVGLVAIPTTERLPVIALASIDKPVQVGDSVLSIGCSGGEIPTRETIEVTSVNKYTGPDNIECTGFPPQGRSGGGLFRQNELVGVCIAADPKDRRGVYTGLTPIYELLELTGFGHLLPVGRPVIAAEVAAAPVVPAAAALPVETPADTAVSPFSSEFAGAEALDSASVGQVPVSMGPAAVAATPVAEPGELQHVLQQAPDAEVICIVRPRNPQIPSRVVIIHEASPKLVGYLIDSTADLAGTIPPVKVAEPPANTLIPTTAVGAAWQDPFDPIATSRDDGQSYRKPLRPKSPR